MLTYRLYCELPFGKLHQRNERVRQLARALGRTPSSVALKLVNFAHLDPGLRARGIRGMSNVSRLDREVAAQFCSDWDDAIEGTAPRWETAMGRDDADLATPAGPSEVAGTKMVRRIQGFFRRAVLAAYDYECCMCRVSIADLLVASHIAPWSRFPDYRADPHNGLSLCAMHDRAFDAGLITVRPNLAIEIAATLRAAQTVPMLKIAFADIADSRIRTPTRFVPDRKLLAYHNASVFRPG